MSSNKRDVRHFLEPVKRSAKNPKLDHLEEDEPNLAFIPPNKLTTTITMGGVQSISDVPFETEIHVEINGVEIPAVVIIDDVEKGTPASVHVSGDSSPPEGFASLDDFELCIKEDIDALHNLFPAVYNKEDHDDVDDDSCPSESSSF